MAAGGDSSYYAALLQGSPAFIKNVGIPPSTRPAFPVVAAGGDSSYHAALLQGSLAFIKNVGEFLLIRAFAFPAMAVGGDSSYYAAFPLGCEKKGYQIEFQVSKTSLFQFISFSEHMF